MIVSKLPSVEDLAGESDRGNAPNGAHGLRKEGSGEPAVFPTEGNNQGVHPIIKW